MAERPKLAPFIPDMVKNIAKTLGIEESQVNIKATTEEGLGFTGTGEGMKAQAVCLLKEAINEDDYMMGGCGGCGGCGR